MENLTYCPHLSKFFTPENLILPSMSERRSGWVTHGGQEREREQKHRLLLPSCCFLCSDRGEKCQKNAPKNLEVTLPTLTKVQPKWCRVATLHRWAAGPGGLEASEAIPVLSVVSPDYFFSMTKLTRALCWWCKQVRPMHCGLPLMQTEGQFFYEVFEMWACIYDTTNVKSRKLI